MDNQNNTKKDFIFAIGRRRAATAQARFYKKEANWGGVIIKKGEIVVNSKPASEYFGKNFERIYSEPLKITGSEGNFAISIKISGGGKAGQLEAAILAMARGLDKIDKEKFHSSLKKRGLLTRDSRVRERRKIGMGGKSRRRKQSPKR